MDSAFLALVHGVVGCLYGESTSTPILAWPRLARPIWAVVVVTTEPVAVSIDLGPFWCAKSVIGLCLPTLAFNRSCQCPIANFSYVNNFVQLDDNVIVGQLLAYSTSCTPMQHSVLSVRIIDSANGGDMASLHELSVEHPAVEGLSTYFLGRAHNSRSGLTR